MGDTLNQEMQDWLSASEARYRLIANNTNDVIWILDLATQRFKYVSPSVQKLRGYTPDQVLQQSIAEVMTPESFRHIVTGLEERLQAFANGDETRRAQTTEVDQLHQDGSVIPTEVVTTLITNQQGQVVEILGVSRDIRQRRQAEEQLKRSEARYKSLFVNAPIGIFQFDQNGVVLECNDEFVRIIGSSRQALIGLRMFEQIKDQQIIAALMRAIATGAARYEGEYQSVTADKRTPVKIRFIVLKAEDGAFETGIGLVEDNTEQAEVEAALRESERLLNKSQEIAHLGSWELDLTRNVLRWSDMTYRIFGMQPQEFGASYEAFLDAVHPDDRIMVDAAYSESLVNDLAGYWIEHRVVRKDTGQVRIVLERCEHLRDPSGRVVRSVGMVQDITDRKQIEGDLAQALKEKSTLLSDLQHRIKNSLALINSLIWLEMETTVEPETQTALANLRDRVYSLADLYTILFQSRSVEQIQLDQYLSRVARSLAGLYLSNRLNILLHVDCEPVLVDSREATPLGLILNELLTNAFKHGFSGERSGHIWVRLHTSAGKVILEVVNDGVKLPLEFDLHQAGGMGLQIVQMLSLQMGGQVTYKREDHTVFSVEVPVEALKW